MDKDVAETAVPDDSEAADDTAVPSAEVCDGIDNDGDGLVDDEDSDLQDGLPVYPDADADGYGDESREQSGCVPGAGQVLQGGDCDDSDDAVNPDQIETCDGRDENCDGQTDELGAEGEADWLLDADGDGYGDDDAAPERACDAPSGSVALGGDCDDGDADINPAAEEICADEADNNCDGSPAPCAPWGDGGLIDADGVLVGALTGGAAGTGLAAADLDGDGADELLIGAPNAASQTGAAYVWRGLPSGEASLADAALTLSGEASGDYLGWALGGGDLDGDGLADLAVGAFRSGHAVSKAGAVYLIWGPAEDGDLEDSLALTGANAGDQAGRSVAFAGLGEDGAAALVTGAEYAASDGVTAGTVYVSFEVEDSRSLADDQDFALSGDSASDRLGYAVAAGGDLDGDGLADLAAGAPEADPDGASGAGEVLWVSGPGPGERLVAADAVVWSGLASGDRLGLSLDFTTDLDGDGYDELLAGGDQSSSGDGVVWLISASTSGSVEDVASLRLDGDQTGERAGTSVACLGDLDGDGAADLAVGAPQYWQVSGVPGPGAAYVLYGPPPTGTLALGALAEGDAAGARLAGDSASDAAGTRVGVANMGGTLAFLVAATAEDSGASDGGAVYVFAGGGY